MQTEQDGDLQTEQGGSSTEQDEPMAVDVAKPLAQISEAAGAALETGGSAFEIVKSRLHPALREALDDPLARSDKRFGTWDKVGALEKSSLFFALCDGVNENVEFVVVALEDPKRYLAKNTGKRLMQSITRVGCGWGRDVANIFTVALDVFAKTRLRDAMATSMSGPYESEKNDREKVLMHVYLDLARGMHIEGRG